MKESIDLSKYSIRTDLAIEATEMALAQKAVGTVEQEENLSQIEGVIIKEKEVNDIKISLVEVSGEAESQLGKKAGRYLTIEVQGIREQDTPLQQKVEEIFASEFSLFFN
jgi:spore protease